MSRICYRCLVLIVVYGAVGLLPAAEAAEGKGKAPALAASRPSGEVAKTPASTAAKPAKERNNEACLNCHGDADSVKPHLVVTAELFKNGPHTEDNGVSCVSCHVKAAKVADITEHGKLGPVSCSECHEAARFLKRSVHGPAAKGNGKPIQCASCHGAIHGIVPVKDSRSPVHPQKQPVTCAQCHRKSEAVTNYLKSIHAKRLNGPKKDGPSCSSCHRAHATKLADIQHNPEFKVQMVKTCGGCHAKEAALYRPSAHGEALLKQRIYTAPSCVDCHLSHDVEPPADPLSTVHRSKTVDLCADCHANTRLIRKLHIKAGVVETYSASFHGRAGRLGSKTIARCTSCHESHGVFRQNDPRSSVHRNRLAQTCGKCHGGADAKFVDSKIHVPMGGAQNYWAHSVRQLYIFLILIVLGGMVIHNLADFIRKTRLRAIKQALQAHVMRMSVLERVLHAALAISFLALCYTGFALLYPRAWWVTPLNWISESEEFRSGLHRVCGVVLTLISLHHLWFIFFHQRGKEQFRRLLPSLRDLRDVRENISWMAGRRTERPSFGRFTYMEKAEYWALVWGTAVMVLTGLVLWFEGTALKLMPLWLWEVFQVVHRFEAILAFGAIVVWHFYYVMVNPDEAPLSLTFMTGRMSLEELSHCHRDEYDEIVSGKQDAVSENNPNAEAVDKSE